jgi:hypothetical protein
MPTHAVVWIDHTDARIFHVDPEVTDETTAPTPQHHVHRRPSGQGPTKEDPDDIHRFFGDVGRALDDVHAVIIIGPSSAKLEFFRYVHQRHQLLDAKVVSVDTADDPSDGALVARAKAYFKPSHRRG